MEENFNKQFVKPFCESLLATMLEATNCASRLYRSVMLSDPELAEEYWEIYLSVRNLFETILKSKRDF